MDTTDHKQLSKTTVIEPLHQQGDHSLEEIYQMQLADNYVGQLLRAHSLTVLDRSGDSPLKETTCPRKLNLLGCTFRPANFNKSCKCSSKDFSIIMID